MIVPFLSLALLALASPAPSWQIASSQVQSSIYSGAPDSGHAVCFKMRSYIFERNDDAAPKLVRETTCSSVRPRLNRSKMPKARIVPAN
jgi:hypothetical protein